MRQFLFAKSDRIVQMSFLADNVNLMQQGPSKLCLMRKNISESIIIEVNLIMEEAQLLQTQQQTRTPKNGLDCNYKWKLISWNAIDIF